MLFKNIAEIKNYITLNTQTDIKIIAPHVNRAEQKYIKPYLGKTLLAALTAYVKAEAPTEDPKLDALLPYVLSPLAYFSYAHAIPQLNVVATNNGFGVIATDNISPASKQRVDDLEQSQIEAAWDGIESLLEFLEENAADYTTWKESAAYTLAYRNLINSTFDFNKCVNINVSRLAFAKLRPEMDNIEALIIEKTVSSQLVDELMNQIKAGTIKADYKLVLTPLQNALANLTLGQHISDPETISTVVMDVFSINDAKRKRYTDLGNSYLNIALDVLKKNPDKYPEYRDSGLYSVDAVSFYENTPESSIFLFGSSCTN